MASLSEMLQYAEYMAQNKRENSLPGRLASLVEAGMGGYEYGAKIKDRREKRKQGALDFAVKQLDMQKKQADIEQDAINRKISNNLAKSLGILDLDDNEAGAVRTTALESATAKKPVRDNTSNGRMASIYAGNEEYHVVPGSFSPDKGLTYDFVKAKKDEDKSTEKDPTARNARIRNSSIEAAKRLRMDRAIALGMDPVSAKRMSEAVSEDEVAALYPEMELNLFGDQEKAKTTRKNRQSQEKVVTDYLQTIQTQIQDERSRLGVTPEGGSKTTLYSMFHKGDEAKLEKLQQRRDKLIQGGGAEELRNQLREDLSELKKDPAKNRAQIVELTKQLLQLAQTGRR